MYKGMQCLYTCVVVWRYQPETSLAYELSDTQEEPGIKSYNVEMLPKPERRLLIRNLFAPPNTEPSPQSGSVVNICTCLIGEMKIEKCPSDSPGDWYSTSLSLLPGVLVFVFGVVAVQGGLQTWSVSVLCLIFATCLILMLVVWRQPQSKTKLAFKVECLLAQIISHIFTCP